MYPDGIVPVVLGGWRTVGASFESRECESGLAALRHPGIAVRGATFCERINKPLIKGIYGEYL